MIDIAQIDPGKLDELSADQLRELTRALLARTDHDGREIVWRDAKIDKLTFEIAQLKRMKFDRSSSALNSGRCSTRRSTVTSRRSTSNSPRCRQPCRPSPKVRRRLRSARRCPIACRGATCTTSPRAPTAAVAR